MDVYRLQGVGKPETGPWNVQDPREMLFSIMTGEKPVVPAVKADIVAQVLDLKMPSAMPNPQKDGIVRSRLELMRDNYLHAGFKSIEQYHEWFSDTLVRKALFVDHEIELVHYIVPDNYVLVGEHQVLFDPYKATSQEVIPEEEAIR